MRSAGFAPRAVAYPGRNRARGQDRPRSREDASTASVQRQVQGAARFTLIWILVRPVPGDLMQPAREERLAFGLTATAVEQQPEHLRWTAEDRGRLAVVAAVTDDPGWPATVDGTPAPVPTRWVVLTLGGLLTLARLRRGRRAGRGRPAGPGAAACRG
jgi:hypothetical protein